MCKKLYLLLAFILLSNHIVIGKKGADKKNIKNINRKSDNNIEKVQNERGKRSVGEIEKSFLVHIEPDTEEKDPYNLARFASVGSLLHVGEKKLEDEPPFWGTRGRRDSSSESVEYTGTKKAEDKNKKCLLCDRYYKDFFSNKVREEFDPFWFERGVKSSEDISDFGPFWGNRGRRSKMKWKMQDENPLFWGNRGRRDETEPFWGNRGKRDEKEPFWGNRGRRDETEPFWGNRGKRDEKEPFWGTRGRRDEIEPFWGNRGKREENEPFWGTRGRRKTENDLWGEGTKQKENDYWTNDDLDSDLSGKVGEKSSMKENTFKAVENIEHSIEKLSRMRRGEGNSFWNNRGRESKLEKLFKEASRNRNPLLHNRFHSSKFDSSPAEQNTVLDERMYAEQPHYILIERSSRSSAEEDPFFISRGKKYTASKLPNGVRGRRGVLEELVKSVRNDPYYIARGKKSSKFIKIGNSTVLKDEFLKAKDLICAAVELLISKNDGHKVKRDADESERDRRTILKNLAAQLQMDPYFVSRGKRNENTEGSEELLEEFVNHITDMCNHAV